ncbi:MAG: TIGR02281 family clan AA aspartic protease [Cytophagales bacterium]|nr:TIGR02281 family clan AA aspartic protease [Cytophagales bacterium]
MVSTFNRLAPLGVVTFWLALMVGVYFGFNHFMKPKPQVITSTGDLVIERSRDGHFYADGAINGARVRFLVDTGASLVAVSESFAKNVGLSTGEPTTFHTANGSRAGYIAPSAEVSVGSMFISSIRVGVGLTGHDAKGEPPTALLGQNFLSKFDVTIGKDQMTIKQR